MLRQPGVFLPVRTVSGRNFKVSMQWSGDCRFSDPLYGDLYINRFRDSLSFYRVVPRKHERVTETEMIRFLQEAKYQYVEQYFEH